MMDELPDHKVKRINGNSWDGIPEIAILHVLEF